MRIFLNTDSIYLESTPFSKWRGQSIKFSIFLSGKSIAQKMAGIYLLAELILVQAIFLLGKSDIGPGPFCFTFFTEKLLKNVQVKHLLKAVEKVGL